MKKITTILSILIIALSLQASAQSKKTKAKAKPKRRSSLLKPLTLKQHPQKQKQG
ncbi:hypothetical protein ACVW0P_001549 [Mucilaginibacter sp. UYNi724]